ncbi:MAG: phytanoyl-CoA dioxygenase family protein [Verrucomicrobiota bacterium]|nr:phytanoyl-CoA dioxygenase family protein [Verrucomicrobiota bacterium]
MGQKSEIFKTFKLDGFVAIPSFYGVEQSTEIKSELCRFKRDVMPELESTEVFFEDKQNPKSLKQIQRMHQYDSYFLHLMNDKPRRLAEFLLGEKVVLKNLQYFNKSPLLSSATPPHQYGYYFMLDHPAQALTMWLALDAIDDENGCVRYVRGSHEKGMRLHNRTQTLGFSQGISDFGTEDDIANEVACHAQSGDLLVHQAMTIHRADANKSNVRHRRALGVIFYGASAKENITAHQAYNKKLESELSSIGKI